MSDGKDCVCAAWNASECGCDADWTPKELIEARATIATITKQLQTTQEAITEIGHHLLRTREATVDEIVEAAEHLRNDLDLWNGVIV